MKRFYKDVAVEGGEIRLDGRTVKTPAGAPLALRTRALADAVAAEWRAQGDEIRPPTMPLTMLANTAIDGIAKDRATAIAALARFGAHDLLCYRSEIEELTARENAGWDPLLAWAAERHGAHFHVVTGIRHVEQPAHQNLARVLDSYDNYTLAGLGPVVSITGSLVLGLALAEGRVDAKAAFALSRLDEAYQIEKWGTDEEAERRTATLEAELATAARFIALTRA